MGFKKRPVKLILKEWTIYFIASNHKSFIVRLLARVAKSFIKGYENYSFNINLNGELRVIKILSESDFLTIFDVGANHGEWSLGGVKFFSKAHFYAFELAPKTYNFLEKNTKSHKRITAVNHGLGDKVAEVEFNYAKGHDTHSSLCAQLEGEYETEKTSIITGDSYLEKKGISEIDFLKVDVEGGEHLVLKGFEESLGNGKIKVIQFEYGSLNKQTKFLLKDFYDLLTQHGFSIGKIYPKSVDFKDFNPDMEDFVGVNYLAVKKEYKHLISKLN